ncbi:TIGR00282 family metallophosphoesterase [Rubrobacter xylanophilus]|uniref:TIGR00282 family metallophosphoesterase n=1 Tax=Rubrobacter xylanophilus TaxID=49319 RepID=UPI001F258654|nr:TIGR00282 family metallophosphoesterase [Rubrobacter xylanophilus]
MGAVVLRLLFIGDVVGERAVEAVAGLLPGLREELRLDGVVVNGENAAGGAGITPELAERLLSAADFITLGDHAFDREEAAPYLEQEGRIIRPANLPEGLPGQGWGSFEAGGARVGVVCVQGRLFMREVCSPFEAADRALEELRGADVVLFDLHAEATSEKQALGWHLDGRAAAALGTHTHVPTADLRLLPGGTAYVSDVGMAGSPDGIIGMDREGFMEVFFRRRRAPVRPAAGPVRVDAVLVEADPEGGGAVGAERVFREIP